MNFAQVEYILFLALIVAVSWRLSGPTARKMLLLVASYYFYAYWDLRFTGLLIISTLWDFGIGRLLGVTNAKPMRRVLLIASLAGNLGLLGFFKYYNFFVDSRSEERRVGKESRLWLWQYHYRKIGERRSGYIHRQLR